MRCRPLNQSKKAVISCTDSGGTLELIDDGHNGRLVAPTPQALAAAMDELYEDRKNEDPRPDRATPGFRIPQRVKVQWVSDSKVSKMTFLRAAATVPMAGYLRALDDPRETHYLRQADSQLAAMIASSAGLGGNLPDMLPAVALSHATYAAVSTWHWNVAPASLVKLTLGDAVFRSGGTLMVVSGADRSTVHVTLAGVGSVLPAASVARTSKVCGPSSRGEVA